MLTPLLLDLDPSLGNRTRFMAIGFVWNPRSGLHCDRQETYQVYVAKATKRSPRFCGAQLNPSHGTGAWTLQEL